MKNLTLKILCSTALALTVVLTCYAINNTPAPTPAKPTTTKPTVSIVGNPVGGEDSYTVNSATETSVNLQCVFINTGDKPADLQIWTVPKGVKPEDSIHLKAASNHKPFQVAKTFHLNLKPHWWCRIYIPRNQIEKWDYCSYFSISDATISKHNPFATWDKTTHSKDTSYHCRIKKPSGKMGFFYFK